MDATSERMAIHIVPARELSQPHQLVLHPVCHVRGSCLLVGVTKSVAISNSLETPAGETFGSLTPRTEVTPDGLRVDFQMRLPPGEYVFKSSKSSDHAGFSIPFTIKAGEQELDVGSSTVEPAGTSALKGKPAPALDLQWRPGQQTNWERLRGRVVVLDFWGTWCVPCVTEMPHLMDIHDQFRDQPVTWVSVHSPNLKSFEEFDTAVAKIGKESWNNRELPFITTIDHPLDGEKVTGRTSQNFGIVGWPTLIVIDPQGDVVGAIPDRDLAATIRGLLDKGTTNK
jgi:thiol-disulfide isomerase/thioredoxin